MIIGFIIIMNIFFFALKTQIQINYYNILLLIN